MREFFLIYHSPVDHWLRLQTPLSPLVLANIVTIVNLALLFSYLTYAKTHFSWSTAQIGISRTRLSKGIKLGEWVNSIPWNILVFGAAC